MTPISNPDAVGIVVIGRNEGERLRRCLQSLSAQSHAIVYVDSGSTDASLEIANAHGARCVELDLSHPFTAARARNAGARVLLAQWPQLDCIQFVDGDCEVAVGWIDAARDFLRAHADVAVVCGRRKERFPERSIYNRLCDLEWDTPIGAAKACGGDAMIRARAFVDIGGFRDALIAGEEPELCVRLRAAGWKIWRLDRAMTAHDAAMSRFSQWWKRTERAGYAFAEGAALHGAPPERHWRRERRRALVWGALMPLALLLAVFCVGPAALLGVLIYPLQIVRLALRGGHDARLNWLRALFLVTGKFAEARGCLRFFWRRCTGGALRLIEYK